MWEARKKGILFDLGHGNGGFYFRKAVPALKQGFLPDTISTDIHKRSIMLPRANMATTMSKFLALGVTLDRVVEMSTTRPAAVLKQSDQLGTLRMGTRADVTVLENRAGRFVFTDAHGGQRIGKQLLVAAATVRRGVIVPGGGGLRMRHLAQ